MGAFRDPAASTMTRNTYLLLLFWSTTTNMRQIVTALDLLLRGSPIVAGIQTEMLREFFCSFRTHNDDTIQSGTEQAHNGTIGSINDEGPRNPGLIREETAFGSPLAAISGIGTSCIFAERGLPHRTPYV
jgi:hypothetical protein